MGYTRTASRAGRGEGIGHHEGRYRQEDLCRSSITPPAARDVMKFTKEWDGSDTEDGLLGRPGEPVYHVRQPLYRDLVVSMLKELYKKGLLYIKAIRSSRIRPLPGTGLEHARVEPARLLSRREGYDLYGTVPHISTRNRRWRDSANRYFLAWTTTPWTLPSNTALCVGPNIHLSGCTDL